MNKIREKLCPEVFDALAKENFTSLHSILTAESRLLQDITHCSSDLINEIKIIAAQEIVNNKITTANQITLWERISTGSTNIDMILNGGIPLNGIIEIYGCSGVGKTQFCLQLALQVQLPKFLGGKDREVVFISTEDVFPSKRFNQLSTVFKNKYNLQNVNFEDHVYVEHIADSVQLLKLLKIRLPVFLKTKNIGLIVIDSIAGVFRSENNNPNYVFRSQELNAISKALNALQDQHHCAVMITNQVTENIEKGISEPCLGLAWSNNVTCRFCLSRYNESQLRSFEVIFSPDLPPVSSNLVITPEGIKNA